MVGARGSAPSDAGADTGRHVLAPAVAERLRAIVGDAGLIVDPGALLVYESDGLTAYRERP